MSEPRASSDPACAQQAGADPADRTGAAPAEEGELGNPVLPELSPGEGRELARLAVEAIAAHLRGDPRDRHAPEAARLRAPGASFVTLETSGRLRGCIGTLRAVRPLYLDVAHNARRATADPRLPPVTLDDWTLLEVHVAVLSEPMPLPAQHPAELLAGLRPGRDGLILEDGHRRATFLPVVWRKLRRPDEFVRALLAKGGWPAGEWPSGLRASRYTSAEYTDTPPRMAIE